MLVLQLHISKCSNCMPFARINKNIPRRFLQAAALAAFAGFAGLSPSGCGDRNSQTASGTGTGRGGAAPVAVRLAYFPNVTHAPALVGVADGAFDHALEGAGKIEPKVFLDGPSEMEALLAGEVDIAYVGVSPAINAFIKSDGALQVVSGAASGGAVLVARSDSGINQMTDLVGKRIGTPKKGGTQDIAVRYYITKTLNQKLAEDGGATRVIPTESPQLAALFDRKELDAAWMQEPWGARLIAENNAKLILDERDLWPGKRFATTVVVARTAFLKEHPDLVEKVVRAHVAVSERIEKDKAKAGGVVGAEIKRITRRALAPAIITDSLARIEFTADPLTSTMQTQADHAFALGFLGRAKPDLSGFVDDALISRITPAGGANAEAEPAVSASGKGGDGA